MITAPTCLVWMCWQPSTASWAQKMMKQASSRQKAPTLRSTPS